MDEKNIETIMQLIVYGGNGKSCSMEAIRAEMCIRDRIGSARI